MPVILQHCVFPPDRHLDPLYFRIHTDAQRLCAPELVSRYSITLQPGACLATNTYFNAFFEPLWRQHTTVELLHLRLRVSGCGKVQIIRTSLQAPPRILEEKSFAGQGISVVLNVPLAQSEHAGLLHFGVQAEHEQVHLHHAEWLAHAAPARVSLVVGISTFSREVFLLDNVKAILGDESLAEVVDQVIVVDQGPTRVRQHPAYRAISRAAARKLRIIEQDNYGGAGGFTRAILEALGTKTPTHMVLMDDDTRLEPESLFRMAAFFALARGSVSVGGPMLDLRRPLEIHQAGASILPGRLGVASAVTQRSVEHPELLPGLLKIAVPHYNPWWLFAFPLGAIDQVGLPLPLFLRGDDAEFGWRLRAAGISTVLLPGVSLWHEPFYVKKGSWHPYYDLRNMLILTAIHFRPSWLRMALIFLRRLVNRLLCLDYFQAALLCDALDDFCTGPAILEEPPGRRHSLLAALSAVGGLTVTARASLTAPVQDSPPPASLLAATGRFFHCLFRQVARASPAHTCSVSGVLSDAHAGWWSLGLADVAAVCAPEGGQVSVFRRSRKRCLGILLRGLVAVARSLFRHRRAGKAWRAALPRLTSRDFWARYLELPASKSCPIDQPCKWGDVHA